MKSVASRRFERPRARGEGLQIQELGDEMLIYDLERHRAHSLNHAATVVWRNCDGKRTPHELAQLLEKELQVAADREFVGLVLARLAAAHLLQDDGMPAGTYSRRDFVRKLRKLGLAASSMLPLVTSIVSPAEAQVVSCVSSCVGQANCTPCLNPGGQCNNWRCCNGSCVAAGQAAQCGC